jgi:hypothetical protein
LREVYYMLYADGYEKPSRVAIYPEEPSLGRISADSVAPPHSPTSIKRCISRVEKNPALIYADIFADTACDTPLREGYISIHRTDGPGLSPSEPMAIVQDDSEVRANRPQRAPELETTTRNPFRVNPFAAAIQVNIQVESPPSPPSSPIPDGKYVIKNKATDIYWSAEYSPIRTVYFYSTSTDIAKKFMHMQVNEHSPIIQVFR